jgi:hypothetical protein
MILHISEIAEKNSREHFEGNPTIGAVITL